VTGKTSLSRVAGHLALPRAVALPVLLAICAAAIAFAAALSTGGHASIDATQQIYEGQTGRSVSWNPPFMSALFAAFGASPQAGAGISTAIFVAVVCILLWGAPALVAWQSRAEKVSIPAFLFALLLVFNPTVIVYAGIVWKDVLFGAMAGFSIALGLLAIGSKSFAVRVLVSLMAAALIGLLPLVRQQGWVMAPILLGLPVLAMFWMDRASLRLRGTGVLAVVLACVIANVVANTWAERLVKENGAGSMSQGFNSIYMFDLAGIEVYSREGPLVALGAPQVVLQELVESYDPQRIDFFDQSPTLSSFLGKKHAVLGDLWRGAVIEHPGAYATHRKEVLGALFGFVPAGSCLPVHLGIEGFEHQTTALRLAPGTDVIDARTFQITKPMFGLPIFRHWAYAAAFAGLALFSFAFRRSRTRVALLVASGSVLLFYGSFVPTAIACDFRYLFPAVPCLMTLSIAFIFRWSEASESAMVIDDVHSRTR